MVLNIPYTESFFIYYQKTFRDDIQFNQINSVKLLVKENVQMNSMMMECPNSVLSDDVKLAKQAKQPGTRSMSSHKLKHETP